MPQAHGYAAQSAETPLQPFSFERRELGRRTSRIEILYCGVCHSDLHTARGEWPGTQYPCVPGHEIIGRVTAVGPRGDAVQAPARSSASAAWSIAAAPAPPARKGWSNIATARRLHRHL